MAMEFRPPKPMLLIIYVAIFSVFAASATGRTNYPIFIFGDSTMDVGTNNLVNNCRARADHPYYGIDYPGHKATGRFSNGLNTADTIVQLLGGYDRSPLPYLELVQGGSNFTKGILNGVNFASGGAGLVKGVGLSLYGQVVSMEEQVQQFATVRGNISALLGGSKGERFLRKSMYIFSVGSNDIMEYIIFTKPVTPEQFVTNITDTYAIHLKNLYSMGARKFGIISIPPLGCCPVARGFAGGNCANDTNTLSRACHESFEVMLENMSSTLKGFKYSIANTYNMTMTIITSKFGFKDVVSACCAERTPQGQGDCKKGVPLCEKRDDYLFWDVFHPSQKASQLAAATLVSSQDPNFISPINFGSLRKA